MYSKHIMIMVQFVLVFLLVVIASTTNKVTAQPQKAYVEYIAHASFRFVAKDGSQIVIDPYNGRIWLGYEYPRGLDADAILITHPHYDHDASYYFAANTPVYRSPKTFEIGSIKVRGVATEHGFADRIRARGFLPTNTAWIIELDGKRIVHFGDSRRVTQDELAEIGPVDVVIGVPNQATLEALGAKHYIANHYRLPSVSETGGRGMSELTDVLAGETSVTRLNSNVMTIEQLQNVDKWIVFQPMQGLKAWPEKRIKALNTRNQAIGALRAEPRDLQSAEFYMNQAIELDPEELSFYTIQAQIYSLLEKPSTDTIELLERGLSKAEYPDWGQAYAIHNQLAKLYIDIGNIDGAKRHYEYIINQPKSYGVPAYETAVKFLEGKRSEQ